MNALIDAVADSIVDEVEGAYEWTVEKKDPMWRSPRKGKVLNVYLGPQYPGEARWTGGATDVIEIFVEYAEPAPENSKNLSHDKEGEYAANEEGEKLRTWALAHPEGFPPHSWKMDWGGLSPTPEVNRELFVRYIRATLRFERVVEFA